MQNGKSAFDQDQFLSFFDQTPSDSKASGGGSKHAEPVKNLPPPFGGGGAPRGGGSKHAEPMDLGLPFGGGGGNSKHAEPMNVGLPFGGGGNHAEPRNVGLPFGGGNHAEPRDMPPPFLQARQGGSAVSSSMPARGSSNSAAPIDVGFPMPFPNQKASLNTFGSSDSLYGGRNDIVTNAGRQSDSSAAVRQGSDWVTVRDLPMPWETDGPGFLSIPEADVFDPLQLPFASPNMGINNPVTGREGMRPVLNTPMPQQFAHPLANTLTAPPQQPSAAANPGNSAQFCSCNRRKGESCSFCWSWDTRSETSAPSMWSAASTKISLRSKASGQYIPGAELDACIEGQRLLYVRPQQLTTKGGKVYIELIRTIPQPLYNEIEVLLVAGKCGMINLKPDAIRKGKKLCVQIPENLIEGQDYDVRVKFVGKMLHGSFPLEIRKADDGDSD